MTPTINTRELSIGSSAFARERIPALTSNKTGKSNLVEVTVNRFSFSDLKIQANKSTTIKNVSADIITGPNLKKIPPLTRLRMGKTIKKSASPHSKRTREITKLPARKTIYTKLARLRTSWTLLRIDITSTPPKAHSITKTK